MASDASMKAVASDDIGTLTRRVKELEEELSALRTKEAASQAPFAFFRGLESSSTYLLVRVDVGGRFLFVNDLYCETFGKRREELLGNIFMPLVHEDDVKPTEEAMKSLFAPPYRTSIEQRALTRNGFRWFVWEDWAIRSEFGEIFEVHAIGRDITDYKHLAEERAELQERALEAQRAAMMELSTPLIPIAAGVIAMPLIGSIDEGRARQMLETILQGVGEHRSSVAIIDITGVRTIDAVAAKGLVQAAQAVRLLGAQVVLTGIGPSIAQTLVSLGADLSGIVTRGTLETGIAYALNSGRSSMDGQMAPGPSCSAR